MYFKDLNIDTIYYEWLGLWNFKFDSQKLLLIIFKNIDKRSKIGNVYVL